MKFNEIKSILTEQFPSNLISTGYLGGRLYIKVYSVYTPPTLDCSKFDCERFYWKGEFRPMENSFMLTRIDKNDFVL